MNTTEFVKRINSLVPSADQIILYGRSKKKEINEADAMDERAFHIVRFNDQLTLADNVIHDLIINTNFPVANITPISFHQEIDDMEGYDDFASYNDHYSFCIGKRTGKIITIEQDGTGRKAAVAESIPQFLRFVVLYTAVRWNNIYNTGFVTDIDKEQAELVNNGFYKWDGRIIRLWITDFLTGCPARMRKSFCRIFYRKQEKVLER